MIPTDAPVLADNVQSLAERQAALDAALLAELRERAKTTGFTVEDGDETHEMTEEDFDRYATEAEATVPYSMNRAERRAAVAKFKANLLLLPRTQPVRNPTIRPRKRR